MAIVRADLVADTAASATLIRPPTSVPSIVKKRRFGLAIGLEYVPSAARPAKRFSRFSRGTRTAWNASRPLSTPSSPTLAPQSSMSTPGKAWPAESRIGTTKA